MKLIYKPDKEIMNVVVFFSGGASSLKAMLNDENYGRLYRVTGTYTDKKDAKGRQLCNGHDIPNLYVSRKGFYSQRGLDPIYIDSRKRFYEMLAREIEQFDPDLICLSGYMHIVTDPLLTEYESRVLNVHPADLAILSGPTCSRLDVSCLSSRQARSFIKINKLARKFKGENAVYDAIAAGERSTRSTVHIATEVFDEGPIVVQSKPFYIDPEIHEKALRGLFDCLQDYASSLQETMKIGGDGPAYLKALKLISEGRLSIDGETLFLFNKISAENREMPYCGFMLG
ncbi:MAG: formyltransferase family protein [Candidatus Aenigmarchaeota archaeon]|nr:formyltransferase family protein [Candidatus Aenigmarchaeota archaeon]MDI6722680.1 formyltransferase family protein [Candidatus Aenigmarchaeota archaeon]